MTASTPVLNCTRKPPINHNCSQLGWGRGCKVKTVFFPVIMFVILFGASPGSGSNPLQGKAGIPLFYRGLLLQWLLRVNPVGLHQVSLRCRALWTAMATLPNKDWAQNWPVLSARIPTLGITILCVWFLLVWDTAVLLKIRQPQEENLNACVIYSCVCSVKVIFGPSKLQFTGHYVVLQSDS